MSLRIVRVARIALRSFAVSIAAGLCVGLSPAHAAEPAAPPSPIAPSAASDADVARLLAVGHSWKTNVVPQGKQTKYGHAEVLVNASAERIMQVVTAYGQYRDLVPEKFKTSRVIAKDQAGSDVYLQIPMKGPLPITLAPVLRFAPPAKVSATTTVVEGKFVRGSYVKDADVIFTVRQVSPDICVLKLDLLILPTIPATQGMLDEELRDAARQAVDAVHDKAQGNSNIVTAVASN